ncbi:hypothetical protein D3C75_988270 [compost metagenome]
MDAAGTATVAAADVQVHALVAAARRRVVGGHRPQLAKGQTGFLHGLATGHLLRHLVLVDQPGHQLQQPGVRALVQRADAELLDQHHRIAQRIVGQHADRIVADEQLAADHRSHAASEQLVAQVHAIQRIEATETGLALDDFHFQIGRFRRLAHILPPLYCSAVKPPHHAHYE